MPVPARLAALLLFVAAPVWAQSAAPPARPLDLSPVARQTLGLTSAADAALYAEGRAALVALRPADARAAFGRLSARGHAAGGYGQNLAALWEALITEERAAVDRFHAVNDSVARVADRLPDSPQADWMRASVALHRALVLSRAERYARAGIGFRDACRRFRSLSRARDASPDVAFGQGVCEVAAGSVPRKYRWLVRLVGISGTVAGGLEHLGRAAAGGGADAMEATAVRALVDESLNGGRAGAQAGLQTLAEAHPASPVLSFLVGYQHLVDRRAAEAEASLRRAQTAVAVPGTLALPTLPAQLGTAVLRQDRFAEAAPLIEQFVSRPRGRALVAQATLLAGIAREMAGDRRAAEAHYRRVRATRDYDTDLARAPRHHPDDRHRPDARARDDGLRQRALPRGRRPARARARRRRCEPDRARRGRLPDGPRAPRAPRVGRRAPRLPGRRRRRGRPARAVGAVGPLPRGRGAGVHRRRRRRARRLPRRAGRRARVRPLEVAGGARPRRARPTG